MRLTLSSVALLAAFALPAAAHADTSFILTTNGDTYTFSLGATTFYDSSPNFYVTFKALVTGPGGTSEQYIDFYNPGNPNVFGGADFHNSGPFVYVDGPILFTGSTSDPDFIDGLYHLSANASPYDTGAATLRIGPAPAPEPSSLVLLGTGILGLVSAARRRFTRG